MRRGLLGMCCWACLVLLSAARAHAAPAPFADWLAFHHAFSSWALDSTRVAEVHSRILERDAGTIVLEAGRLVFAVPFPGHTRAAVFVGRGTFRFVPRTPIEQQQMRRFFGDTTLTRHFQSLTMLFADTTDRDLEGLEFHPDTLGQLRTAWRAANAYLTVKNTHLVRPLSLAQTLLDGEPNGYFWALISDLRSEAPLFFTLDPFLAERVVLANRPENDREGFIRHYDSETVCQTFAVGDPDTLHTDVRPLYDASHFAIDLTLHTDLQSNAFADVVVRAHDAPHAWLAFVLPADLHLDSVTDAGRPVMFYQERENTIVWLHCDPPLVPGVADTLRFRYQGLLFERHEDWLYPRYTTAWYPRPVYGADATWDLSFHYPKDMQVLAPGTRVFDRVTGMVHHARWIVERPVPWASFDANFLRGIEVTADSLPPLTVWLRHLDGAGQVRKETYADLSTATDDDRRVAFDVAHCLRFFQGQFGAPLATAFQAVETPLQRYEAYPGLIHMMRHEDQPPGSIEQTPDLIRAHEIAHQWWGLGLAAATYHDAWLSEGFADFCSAWYVQAGRHDARAYHDVLESWRLRLLENRKFLLGDGQEAGPIWLGPRTNSSRTPNDYNLVIYAKGAWVLHMLRNYLLDPDDPGEQRFRGLMHDFYQRYAGRRTFTEDFRAAVERAAGEDMGWFFAQWVYGTDVPTYRVRWTTAPADGGQWRIHGHVEQLHVPADFRMPVFVRVGLGPGQYASERVWIRGPVTDFDLPLAPRKPTELVFNDLQSVLCEVEKLP